MTGGANVWEPHPGGGLDEKRLAHFVTMSKRVDLDDIAGSLSEDEIGEGASVMKLPAGEWQIAEALGDDDIVDLIRFFTLAEMQLTGWDGGKDSPVIPLVKILRERDRFDEDLRKWIKGNTDNRYLPYGSAL